MRVVPYNCTPVKLLAPTGTTHLISIVYQTSILTILPSATEKWYNLKNNFLKPKITFDNHETIP